ncbi:toll/interleukin-1 receptor domain-containing protein [Altericista sp. CCNU0014]|uniref:toll/interleukin-1 receptor domain-containing protein n=1 Tax=Altericista sp. CCNU0014 TaxID=3082949 RepID=UPI00384FEDAB
MSDAETTLHPRPNEIFISYSRRDKSFVQKLDRAFRQVNRDPWIDWEDIQEGELWREAIHRGIIAADVVICAISPDSVLSQECRVEIEYALKLNKRIIPVLVRDTEGIHPALAEINWIFFRESDDFDTAFQKLLSAIDTEQSHVQMHTRLLGRAIEWERGRDDGFLLRGQDLANAEQWLAASPGKDPPATQIQRLYLAKSREVETADRRLAAAGRKARRIIALSAVTLTVTAISTFAIVRHAWQEVVRLKQQTQVLQTQIRDLDARARELSDSNDALIAFLKQSGFTDERIQLLLDGSQTDLTAQVAQVGAADRYYRKTVARLKGEESNIPQSSPSDPGETENLWPGAAPTPSSSPFPILLRPSPVTIEYYPKDIDPQSIQQALTKLGFNLKLQTPTVTDVPINIIYYGKNVREADVKLVAYVLQRAGVQLKAIQPFRALAESKAWVIQVGALSQLKDRRPISAAEIDRSPLPLPRQGY